MYIESGGMRWEGVGALLFIGTWESHCLLEVVGLVGNLLIVEKILTIGR